LPACGVTGVTGAIVHYRPSALTPNFGGCLGISYLQERPTCHNPL